MNIHDVSWHLYSVDLEFVPVVIGHSFDAAATSYGDVTRLVAEVDAHDRHGDEGLEIVSNSRISMRLPSTATKPKHVWRYQYSADWFDLLDS